MQMTGEAATHCTLGKARGRRPMDTCLVTLVLVFLLVLNFKTHHDCAYWYKRLTRDRLQDPAIRRFLFFDLNSLHLHVPHSM